jgi:large subunit ribosomal protein L10
MTKNVFSSLLLLEGGKKMPSEKVLQQKQQIVAEFSEKLKAAVAGVLIDYRGLSVEEDTALRNQFRAAGVSYEVIKNTLLGFAAKDAGIDGLDDVLHGPTAIAYHNDDLVAPAKIAADFIKKNDKISIKLGFMEGIVISLDEVNRLARTPPLDVLIAKLMGSLNAPASALARLLNAIVENGVELADLAVGKTSETAPVVEEVPAVEETAPVVEEASVVEEAAPVVEKTAVVTEETVPEVVPEAAQEAAAVESEAPAEEVPAVDATEESTKE